MADKDIIENLVNMTAMANNVQNAYLKETVRLDDETLSQGSIKHMCDVNTMLISMEIQNGQVRYKDGIYEVHIATCPFCLKTYYSLEKIEVIDLTPYKEQLRMQQKMNQEMIQSTYNGYSITKEQLINLVFPVPMEMITMTQPNYVVLETLFDPSSLVRGTSNYSEPDKYEENENIKVKSISSWDDL